jgi:hypothetical protein
MANAMEPLGQHVEQKTPDELACIKRHHLVAFGAVAAIVLVAEGDAPLVEADQPRVGDGDAVGLARQIGQHRLGACEGGLGVDEPILPAQGCQEAGKGAAVAEARMRAEELEMPGRMGVGKL